MVDKVKAWTKELDQISTEVKKFINNIKVCSKSNSIEDDLIANKKTELISKLDVLVDQIKFMDDDGEQCNVKLSATKAKLLEKIAAQKVKVEGCAPSQTKSSKNEEEMKTQTKEISKSSKKKETSSKKSTEDMRVAESKSEKTDGKRDQLKRSKSPTKKERKTMTEPSQMTIPTIGDTPDSRVKQDTEKTKTSKKSSFKKQDSKTEPDTKETDLKKTSKKKSDIDKEKKKELKQTKRDKTSKGKKENVEKPEHESIEEIPSELEAPSTFRTETDQATDGLNDVVSELEDFSLTTDNASLVVAQPQPTKPTSILKRWTQSDEKISAKVDRFNESVPVPKAVINNTTSASQGELFVAIRGWTGEEKDDLSFEPGCKLKVLQKNEDGWWLAQDHQGKSGLVPMNFLKEANGERPLQIRDEKARITLVQEAFAEVFKIEDAADAQHTEELHSSKNSITDKVPDNAKDTIISEGPEARSQSSKFGNTNERQMTRQDREKIAREAFAEVFRLEDTADKIPAKQAEVHFTTKTNEDTEATEIAASLNEEDTLTLDDLVEENLSASKDSEQLAQLSLPGKQRVIVTSGELECVSVKERVNQWEQIVHSKFDVIESEVKRNEKIIETDKNGIKQNAPGKQVDNIYTSENDTDEDNDNDDDQKDDVDEKESEALKLSEEDNKEEEEEEEEEEDYSEFSDSDEQIVNVPERDSVKPESKTKTDLMKSSARWLYQSNAKLLKSLEPLPSGVRISTISSMDWTKYNYQTFLVPQLGSSHLMLVDLVYDTSEKRVMRRPARIQRIVQIQKCINMPSLSETSVTIQERVARICLFDGQKPISNIVHVPMVTTDREKKQWCLMPQNLLRETKPNDLPADLFVRFNHVDMNVQLLIEVGISVTKPSENVPIELSVGWILVPLYDEKGAVITNRTTDFPLQPGTPFEESVFGEELVKEETFRNRVQNMLFGKQPQVTVRIGQPTREQSNLFETLPDVLIGLCGYLPLMSLYWEMLGNVLFGSTSSLVKDSVYLRQVPPSCALFPYVADTPLLMEALRVSWNETLKDLPANHKKDVEKLQKSYSNHFLRVIYPITCLLNVIPTGPTSSAVFEKKTELVHSLLRQTQTDPLKFYMSTEYKFLAFTTREFTCPIRIRG